MHRHPGESRGPVIIEIGNMLLLPGVQPNPLHPLGGANIR
jgi:hypothetical protein